MVRPQKKNQNGVVYIETKGEGKRNEGGAASPRGSESGRGGGGAGVGDTLSAVSNSSQPLTMAGGVEAIDSRPSST